MHLACKPSSTATACEVTTLQRYRNVCIIINIIVAAVIFSPTTNHRVILQTSQSRSTISLFHYIFHFPVQAQYFPLHDLNIFTPNHCHPLCKRDHPISTCYFKCWIYLSHFTTKTNSQTFEYCINGFKDHWINSKTSNTISTSSQVQFKFAHLAALPRMQWRHWGCGPPRVTPSRGGWHPNGIKNFVAEFTKNTGQTRSERGSCDKTTAKKVIPYMAMTKKRLSGENGVTPSVAAPGDTNPSDAAARTNPVKQVSNPVALITYNCNIAVHWETINSYKL